MIEIYSRKIATYFSKIGIIPSERIEVYRFYFETCCYKLITYSVSIFVFITVHRLLAGLLFLFVFIELRTMTGGYHTNKAISCLFLSPLVISLNVLIIKYLPAQAHWIITIVFLFSVAVILKCSPLSHENNILTEREISLSKKKCKIFTGLTFIGIVLFKKIQVDLCIALELAYISDAFLLLLGILVKEGGEY